MNLSQFSRELSLHPGKQLSVLLPSGNLVAPHFHVTEVGKVSKDFVDCGGVRRSETSCVLQTLVATDLEHRLLTDKLLRILQSTSPLALPEETEIDFEIQGTTIEIYTLSKTFANDTHLSLVLQSKQTACLAPDKCGIGDPLLQIGGSGKCC